MSCFILVEYSVKMICYASMAQFGGGVVHVHSRARDTRGCYTFRYLQWAVAVPTYIALNNSSLWSRSGRRTMAQRLWSAASEGLGELGTRMFLGKKWGHASARRLGE